MEVRLALLADSANISREGKLNLLGIFDTLNIRSFPAVHPNMHLVLRFEATNAEAGRTKEVEVVFMGPDEDKLGSLSGKFVIPKGEAGYPIQISHILSIPPLKFEKTGDYAFVVLVNGDEEDRVSLRVVEAKPSK